MPRLTGRRRGASQEAPSEEGTFLTQDPIGLAGGTNLYAYANNNPLRFRDPFGLDTVTVGHDPDGSLSAAVERCAQSETICGDRYRAAHADSRVYELSIGQLPCCKAGETNLSAHAAADELGNTMTFGPKVTITIDPSNFAAAGDEVTAETGRATTIWMDDAVGHELGGHAAGSLLIHQAGGMRPTRHNPGWCDETCARKFDNTYRDQRGLPPIW